MKIVLLLLLIAGFSSLGAASMMPGINWFNVQEVEVLDGIAEIKTGGTFICECAPMPDPNNPDTNNDGIDDCGPANLNCDPVPCDETIPGGDFCSACNVGGEGQECNVAPNVEGPYFNSAVICAAPTTCP